MPESPDGDPVDPVAPEADSSHAFTYVFVSDTGGVVSSWIVEGATQGPEVARAAQVWIFHDDGGRKLLEQSWTTPYTRSPSRIFPWAGLRLTVRMGGETERLMARTDSAEAELDVVEVMAELRANGSTLKVFRARLSESGVNEAGSGVNEALSGIALEHFGSRPSEASQADWAFLVSEGGTAAFVLLPPRVGSQAPAVSEPPNTPSDRENTLGSVWAVGNLGRPMPTAGFTVVRRESPEGGIDGATFASSGSSLVGELQWDEAPPDSDSVERTSVGQPVGSLVVRLVLGSITVDGTRFSARGSIVSPR